MAKFDERINGLLERVTRLEGRSEPSTWVVRLLVGLVLTGLLAWWGWLSNQVVSLNRESATLLEKIGELRRDVDRLLIPERIKSLTLQPPTKDTLLQVQQTIRQAKEEKMAIDPTVLGIAAKRAAQTSQQHADIAPIAWQTFVDIVHYGSAITAWQSSDFVAGPSGEHGPCFPLPENPKQIVSTINGFTCVDAVQQLDGGDWRNLVFRNSIIAYKGGPVRLTNVRFENCQFRFEVSQRAEKLGLAIVTAMPVTTDLSG